MEKSITEAGRISLRCSPGRGRSVRGMVVEAKDIMAAALITAATIWIASVVGNLLAAVYALCACKIYSEFA